MWQVCTVVLTLQINKINKYRILLSDFGIQCEKMSYSNRLSTAMNSFCNVGSMYCAWGFIWWTVICSLLACTVKYYTYLNIFWILRHYNTLCYIGEKLFCPSNALKYNFHCRYLVFLNCMDSYGIKPIKQYLCAIAHVGFKCGWAIGDISDEQKLNIFVLERRKQGEKTVWKEALSGDQ